MNNENVRASSRANYFFQRFKDGLRSISQSTTKKIFAVLYWLCAAVTFVIASAQPAAHPLERLLQPIGTLAVVVGSLLLFAVVVTASAIPRGTVGLANAFSSAGMRNDVGVPPLAVSRTEQGKRTIVEICVAGLAPSQIRENIVKIESALSKRIAKIEPGRDTSHLILHLLPGDEKLPDKIPLPLNLNMKESEIALGESLDGPVMLDFDKTPHGLFCGVTGGGKTNSLKCAIQQLLDKRCVEVALMDMKGGQDYPPAWRGKLCSFAGNKQEALAQLSRIVEELERREQQFKQLSFWKNRPIGKLADYNAFCPHAPLQRIVIFIDEITVLTDTTGLDKATKELIAAIIGKLTIIACLGRAFGINLIIGTQRPDANSVPGSIKSNIDFRACTHADKTLSLIVLDNTYAADLLPPDSPGLFVTRDGVVYRAYLFDDDVEEIVPLDENDAKEEKNDEEKEDEENTFIWE